MIVDNTTLLTAGAQVYARKRKRKEDQVPEVVFDEKARREYLTGFHKRKLERKAKAQASAVARQKRERLELRKAQRDARKEEAERRIAELRALMDQVNGDDDVSKGNNDDDWEADVDTGAISVGGQSEFRTPETLTTVTVIDDLDLENDNCLNGQNEVQKGDGEDSRDTAKVKLSTGLKKSKKPKKFRYETKAVREAAKKRAKEKVGKSRTRDIGGRSGPPRKKKRK